MLVSSENKARRLLRNLRLCLRLCLVTQRGIGILPHLHTFSTFAKTMLLKHGVFLLCFYDCVPESFHTW